MNAFLLANDIPLAPPLHTRLLALLVIEAALLLLVALLYIKWVQLKNQSLDACGSVARSTGSRGRRCSRSRSRSASGAWRQGDAPPEPPGEGAGGTGAGTTK